MIVGVVVEAEVRVAIELVVAEEEEAVKDVFEAEIVVNEWLVEEVLVVVVVEVVAVVVEVVVEIVEVIVIIAVEEAVVVVVVVVVEEVFVADIVVSKVIVSEAPALVIGKVGVAVVEVVVS